MTAPVHDGVPAAIDSPHVDRRLAVQGSHFMIFGTERDLAEMDTLTGGKRARLVKIIISNQAIGTIETELENLGIKEKNFADPGNAPAALLLEGRTHLVRLLQEIPLGEAEQGAVEDGVAAYENLLSKLSDVPTPAGPTPRQPGAGLVQDHICSAGIASFDPYGFGK